MSSSSNPTQQDHHQINYIEFKMTDLDAARKFYQSAFGWNFNDYGPEYSGIQTPDGGEIGGFSHSPGDKNHGPLIVLYSTDLEQSLEAVKRAGGEITREPFEFPGGRRFQFRDPSGNELGVWSDK